MLARSVRALSVCAVGIADVERELNAAHGAPRLLLFGNPGLGKTATLRNWTHRVPRPFWFVRFEHVLTAFLESV
jgi:stage III sporulation protein SpoIIIAA